MIKEVPKILCITRAVLCEKFKVGGSIARALIKDLYKKSLIKPIGTQHAKFDLYMGCQAKTAAEKAAADAEEAAKKKKWGARQASTFEDLCECNNDSSELHFII